MSNFKYKEILLTNLLVDIDNPRLENAESQVEAIGGMIKDQNAKLYNLAEDIINNGLNPSDVTIVCPDKNKSNMFVVLEGNRRVTALKLLFQPTLIPTGYSSLLKKFVQLNKDKDLSSFEKINCVVFDNYEEAEHWIELKHTGEMDGVGTVRWDSKQQQRFKSKTQNKPTISLQVLEFVEKSDAFDENTKKSINNVSITNLERLLRDPDIRDFIGLDIKDNNLESFLPKKELAKGFKKIISDLSTKQINVNDIYYKKDRQKYIEAFKDNEIPLKNQCLDKPWRLTEVHNQDKVDSNDTKEKNSKKDNSKNTKSKPLSINRKYLIPSECIIRISDSRINGIYREMKKLLVDEFPNSAAVLLRVLLELSIDYYINKKSITSVNVDKSLVKKMEIVIKHLQDNKILNKYELKPARTVLSSNSIFSTETLNAYVHNRMIHPNPKDLKITWDNIELFIKTILTE